MAVRNIVLEGDEILRKHSREVTEFNEKLWQLLDDMAETMYSADGVGLAAVQVGILRKVVVVDTGDTLYEIINPEIIEKSGSQTGLEGCLSSPDEYGEVERPMKVKVSALDRYGKKYTIEGTELLARALCHEIDHLNGVLFKDIAIEMVEIDETKPKKRRKK
ncbi:peptide deformylase [Paludicola sp. MB14-C6]|uniref:peptide deformylase n=1 Tax=Paludihabitans sp. MB14-C6 TaxID=3070656 RepID=UPI0027DCFB05|nr:peptide deformylase [Paludicola sp. MB14-C6]WMJ22377.1 peptide deformylase [Paludicola sp. MB14-C6]